MEARTISKQLAANDTGETGGHQSGILVPKEKNLLSFFPYLDPQEYNPRSHLLFVDESGEKYEFAFIYYNNKFFGGTRNEYRLTRMTAYIRQSGLSTGDEVVLTLSEGGDYSISYRKQRKVELDDRNVLKLGSGWRIIQI